MEKKYRLLILFLAGILTISLASAATFINSPNEININENFNLRIVGSGFYAVEINIPEIFQIVSDPSNGARTDGIYRTFTLGELIIVIRPTKIGQYNITGEYTSGEGIKKLNSVTIQVKEEIIPPSCPICPPDTTWSNCEEGRNIRIVYKCSHLTNYQCIQSIETQDCQIQIEISNESLVSPNQEIKMCEVGWICKDPNNLAYQSSDCSLSSIQNCPRGCKNSECKVDEEVREKYLKDNLTVEIIPSKKQETQSFFAKIIEFIKKILDILIFW